MRLFGNGSSTTLLNFLLFIRGRKIYEPPRFMSIPVAISQLLDVESTRTSLALAHSDPKDRDDDDDYSDTQEDFDDDNPEHIKDLARLALTSRALYLAANPILWESLPGLEPLLDLMPPEAWDGTPLADLVCCRAR